MHFKTPNPSKFILTLAAGVIASLLLFWALPSGPNVASVHAQASDTPTPEATSEQGEESGVQNLPSLEGKLSPPKYPDMDSGLNHIVQQVETGQFTAHAASANAPLHQEESVAGTLYMTEGFIETIVEFLKDNDASPRNIGVDYIEAYVPVSLLVEASDAATPSPEPPPIQGICLSGTAITGGDENPGLVSDCETLLLAENTLAGSGGLNWSVDIPIEDWDGVVIGGTPRRITELILDTRELTGTIPAEVANLSELTYLNLSHNRLTGSIPSELGDLSNLTELWLSENQLSGGIPPTLGGLTQLRWLTLFHNQLSGEIPSELGNLSELRSLYLNENRLTGDIPAELGNLSSLETLHLQNNQLTGCVPDSLRDVPDNRFAELGLPFCGDIEEPSPVPTVTPSPTATAVPTPSPKPPVFDHCIEPLTDSGPVTGIWARDCVSMHLERDGSYARFYAFELLEGSDVVVTLESTVDTYLYLREGIGKDGPIVDEDDDDNDNNFNLNSSTDSGIMTSLDAGSYTIEATTYAAGEGGEFTLVVEGVSLMDTPVPTPTATVVPITPIPPPSRPPGEISIGADHACAIFEGTTIECWGTSDFVGSTNHISIDGRYVAVSSGANHTCGLVENGVINCWGANNYGQLNTPALSASTRYTAVGSGTNHTCALIADGSIICWGANQVGQATPPTGGVFTAIHSGYDSSCALRSDGEYVCWGAVERNLAPSPIPTPVLPPTPPPIRTPDTDRAALVALYDATGGTNWTNSSNWTSDSHLSQWHGVSIDASGRVTSLILEGNGLQGSLPQELGHLTQLQELGLGFNGLTGTLPPELGCVDISFQPYESADKV